MEALELPHPRIVTVKIKVEVDYDYPFDDFVGSFGREPKSKFAINHRRRQGHHDEFEWFNPACAEDRADAERAYLEIMPYMRDQKWMMLITGSGKVEVPCGGGLVLGEVGPFSGEGFDSDDHEGRKDAEHTVREELADELRTLGFSDDEIDKALSNAEVED